MILAIGLHPLGIGVIASYIFNIECTHCNIQHVICNSKNSNSFQWLCTDFKRRILIHSRSFIHWSQFSLLHSPNKCKVSTQAMVPPVPPPSITFLQLQPLPSLRPDQCQPSHATSDKYVVYQWYLTFWEINTFSLCQQFSWLSPPWGLSHSLSSYGAPHWTQLCC